MFELFATSMALDSDYCFGRSGTGFVKGEGVPNPCAVGMGVIAASAVGFNYFPLALESYKHQGRSVSVNGVSAAPLFPAASFLAANSPHPRKDHSLKTPVSSWKRSWRRNRAGS